MKKNRSRELLGGQALIEGVMMKGPTAVGYAVYNPQKKLITKKEEYIPLKKRFNFLGLVLIRGFVNLLEMLNLGIRSITYSSEIAMPEETAKQSKYEMPLSLLISLLLSFVLFIFIPASGFTYLKQYIPNTVLLNLAEGLLRLIIFLLFLIFVSLSRDMRRVFGFHGAEHMTVHAYENGDSLTVKNIKKYSTLHPRCGTSFLLVVMVISIIVYSFLGRPDLIHRILYKVLLLPLIAGISYEFIRLVCRLPKWLNSIFLFPGLMLQKFTTRRPDNKMIEAAIAAIKLVKLE